MDYTVRKLSAKVFTGSPDEIEERINVFLSTIEAANYVDLKVANLTPYMIAVVVIYKRAQRL